MQGQYNDPGFSAKADGSKAASRAASVASDRDVSSDAHARNGIAAALASPQRLAAVTVLHNPEAGNLATMCGALRLSDTPLFVACNSVISPATRNALELVPRVELLGDETNIGVGAALNAAMTAAESAGFTHVLILDQDSTPDAALPQALFERAAGIKGPLGSIGPLLIPPPGLGYKPVWYSFRRGGELGAVAVDFLPTSGSLISVDAWRKIGPFRADYFIDGIDVEWSFRAWKAGFQVLLADDMTMLHRWGQPTPKSQRAQIFRQGPLRNAYYLRNAVYTLRLAHVPLRWKVRSLARLAAQTTLLCLSGEGPNALRAVRAGWSGELGPIT